MVISYDIIAPTREVNNVERISNIAQRLKEYRDQFNLTLSDVSKKCKIPMQTLNRYELEQRVPKIDTAVEIAESLGINPLWLQGYNVPMEDHLPSNSIPFRPSHKAPIVGSIPAGYPVLAFEDIEGYADIPYSDEENYFFLRVNGESMKNAGIHTGDLTGMCVVAAGFNRTAFCARLADGISRLAQGSVKKMMLGYVLIGVLLSQFIQSPVVVFGIVAPMLIASAESMGISPSKVIFPVGVATICTCCTLPLGAGATVAGELNGYIESYGYTQHMVGFLDPMMGRLPMLIIAIVYFSFFALRFSPDEPILPTSLETKKQKIMHR